MSEQTALPQDHPLMVAWEEFKLTPEYNNAKGWAQFPEYVEGAFWAMFVAGWRAGYRLGGAVSDRIESFTAAAIASRCAHTRTGPHETHPEQIICYDCSFAFPAFKGWAMRREERRWEMQPARLRALVATIVPAHTRSVPYASDCECWTCHLRHEILMAARAWEQDNRVRDLLGQQCDDYHATVVQLRGPLREMIEKYAGAHGPEHAFECPQHDFPDFGNKPVPRCTCGYADIFGDA